MTNEELYAEIERRCGRPLDEPKRELARISYDIINDCQRCYFNPEFIAFMCNGATDDYGHVDRVSQNAGLTAVLVRCKVDYIRRVFFPQMRFDEGMAEAFNIVLRSCRYLTWGCQPIISPIVMQRDGRWQRVDIDDVHNTMDYLRKLYWEWRHKQEKVIKKGVES